MFVRSMAGSILLFGLCLLVNACGTSQPAATATRSSTSLRLTALDSTTNEPLDSARAVNRTMGDTLRTDSAGVFLVHDAEPALYIFDISGYGYHPQRHVSVLLEPEDENMSLGVPLLPKLLTINCQGARPYFWGTFTERYREDTTRARIQLIDVFAQDGEVRLQPVVVNDLSSPLFLPNNFGALGHYEVLLYDGDNNPIPYRFENAPHDSGHRIYSKEDILPVVPGEAERLEQSTLVVGDSIENETTIWARMQYTFSPDDTLRATSATTFPDLNLESLQTPVFDTVRTAGEVLVPDSLVVQRDTSIMRVVGIDTVVTRNGYTLYSSMRSSNAARNPQEARNLLYIPDSVKARVRRDSLEALAEARTTVPKIDTSSGFQSPSDPTYSVVQTTNTPLLDSLITNREVVQMLREGLPTPDLDVDSLLTMSDPLRAAYLQPPQLSRARIRRGFDTEPDSMQQDELILSGPASDSLFQMIQPDSLIAADTSASVDSLTGGWDENPFVGLTTESEKEPESDLIPLDSLRLTVSPDADSIVEGSIVTTELSSPPENIYWRVPDSLTIDGVELFVVEPSFFDLRARAGVDASYAPTISELLPNRVGPRETSTFRYPQQVIRIPKGTYRRDYLRTWRKLQQDNLKQHYCQIFPFPLRTEWRSTSMH